MRKVLVILALSCGTARCRSAGHQSAAAAYWLDY